MSPKTPPVLLWFRRDFRLGDHAALAAALKRKQPIIAVFIYDALVDALGAAPKWRLEQAIAAFQTRLAAHNSRLILRRGDALPVLQELITQTGANAVYWSRAYDPDSIARDRQVKTALKDAGIHASSHAGHLLYEPWEPKTGSGSDFKVFTPFWRAVSQQFNPDPPLQAPDHIPTPTQWPESEHLTDWQMGHGVNRAGPALADRALVGEVAALSKLDDFLKNWVQTYKNQRDFPAIAACSQLSEPLSMGEISPRQIYATAQGFQDKTGIDVSAFLRQLIWREFAYHLLWHFPALKRDCWREAWQSFAWSYDADALQTWQWGRTGVDFVDAGMRELYTTGRLHNRLRMIVGSYLCKHLLLDWRLGLSWFEETLIDWDPANNAMGWQWIAGCGPDASPYFRVFNPELQAEKFDPDGQYRNYWLSKDAQGCTAFFDIIPSKQRDACQNRPQSPVQPLADGRARALDAYHAFKTKKMLNSS